MTLQEAKEEAAKKQGFESWASYEKYCKVTDVIKAYPLKMIAMCDLYADIYARAKWAEGIKSYVEAKEPDYEGSLVATYFVPKFIP